MWYRINPMTSANLSVKQSVCQKVQMDLQGKWQWGGKRGVPINARLSFSSTCWSSYVSKHWLYSAETHCCLGIWFWPELASAMWMLRLDPCDAAAAWSLSLPCVLPVNPHWTTNIYVSEPPLSAFLSSSGIHLELLALRARPAAWWHCSPHLDSSLASLTITQLPLL